MDDTQRAQHRRRAFVRKETVRRWRVSVCWRRMRQKLQDPEQYAQIRQALDQLHDDAYRIHVRISKGRKAAASKARGAKTKRKR
jgi:hypothetical protein